MPESIAEQLRRCTDTQSVLDCLLDRGLQVSSAGFGNIQLMNWTAGYLEIKAQRGFREEFINFFGRVKLEDSSACARALRNRDSVIIEDIIADPQFSPCLEIARRAGIRAVQSTPLVSSNGALVGILSTHFPSQHRPTDVQIDAMKAAGQLAANTIIRLRAGASNDSANQPNRRFNHIGERLLKSQKLVVESRETIVRTDILLARDPWQA
jgi:GAF domain-containing protein